MPKRSDEFWLNEKSDLRYCYTHKRYYLATFGCQLCYLANPPQKPQLLRCPKCGENSLTWDNYHARYECVTQGCFRLYTRVELGKALLDSVLPENG